jgi:nucleoside phosphorylase
MLIWLCAMRCEAKPVIDFYRLKKSPRKSLPFDLYQQTGIVCIVSGIGIEKMTAAVNWAQQNIVDADSANWINLGIAGHRDLPVGCAVQASQVTSPARDASIRFDFAEHEDFISAPLISVSSEQSEYDASALHDMEGWGFASGCRQLKAPGRRYCLKIISDNLTIAPTRNKARISALIADKMPQIAHFAKRIQDTRHE